MKHEEKNEPVSVRPHAANWFQQTGSGFHSIFSLLLDCVYLDTQSNPASAHTTELELRSRRQGSKPNCSDSIVLTPEQKIAWTKDLYLRNASISNSEECAPLLMITDVVGS